MPVEFNFAFLILNAEEEENELFTHFFGCFVLLKSVAAFA
jgi:hypothetical protein